MQKDDLQMLSKDFDAVIVAAGPGVNELWPSEDSKDLTFKRGQNLEFYDDAGIIARYFSLCSYGLSSRIARIDVLITLLISMSTLVATVS